MYLLVKRGIAYVETDVYATTGKFRAIVVMSAMCHINMILYASSSTLLSCLY